MEILRKYGWKPDVPDFRDYKRSYGFFSKLGLPDTIDLRDKLSNIPIFDQGQLGSCTANGTCLALEYTELKTEPNLKPEALSRLFEYYNTRSAEGTINSDSGASIRNAIKAAGVYGSCLESEWPYNIKQFTVKPNKQCYIDALQHKALVYERINQDLGSMKKTLFNGDLIVLGISIYEDFESNRVSKSGQVKMPTQKETCLGGHCVTVVGYTDKGISGIPKNSFIMRNSWGPKWGLKGYFSIPYNYLLDTNLCGDLWTINKVS